MIVKLLTEHNLEFLGLKEGCRVSSESTSCQNATLLEISCTGSFYIFLGELNFDIIMSTPSLRCLHCVISSSNSFPNDF